MGVVGIRSGVEVDWFRLPVVYRLGDGVVWYCSVLGFVVSVLYDVWVELGFGLGCR